MTLKRYLVLLGVAVFQAVGDTFLSRGMKEVGEISLRHPQQLILSLANPWVTGGILLLLCFMASYLASLSWADLTYILPASAISYILLALLAKFMLHEQISVARWAGIGLIVAGVGFVAGGSHRTEHPEPGSSEVPVFSPSVPSPEEDA